MRLGLSGEETELLHMSGEQKSRSAYTSMSDKLVKRRLMEPLEIAPITQV